MATQPVQENVPPGQEDPQASAAGGGSDPYKIHDHAVAASKELEALATALGHANAPEAVTKSLTQGAETCRKIASAMARAPEPAPKAAPSSKTGESVSAAADSYAADARR